MFTIALSVSNFDNRYKKDLRTQHNKTKRKQQKENYLLKKSRIDSKLVWKEESKIN